MKLGVFVFPTDKSIGPVELERALPRLPPAPADELLPVLDDYARLRERFG